MRLREGGQRDLPNLADIASQALWNDEIVQYLAPNRAHYPLSHRNHYLYQWRKRLVAGDRLIVAIIDEEDESWSSKEVVAGFAFWSNRLNTPRTGSFSSRMFGRGKGNNDSISTTTDTSRVRAFHTSARKLVQMVFQYGPVIR